ncbi:Uncharacterised protein [Bordetella pertussis]|nr:Uncharacterised protein [Bordetella pertussis]
MLLATSPRQLRSDSNTGLASAGRSMGSGRARAPARELRGFFSASRRSMS